MFRRLMSTKISCSNCRLYEKKTQLCKINKKRALSNRLDDDFCGYYGKKFWELDKTKLILSNDCKMVSNILLFISAGSLIPAYIEVCEGDYGIPIFLFAILSNACSYKFLEFSTEHYQQYLDDNNLDDNNINVQN